MHDESQANSSPETAASQVDSIKLEDFGSKLQIKKEYLATSLPKRPSEMEEESLTQEDKPQSLDFPSNGVIL